MDSGELDFYQHDKVCSNTCRSTKIDLSGARVSLSSPTSAEYIPLTPATADGRCGSEPPPRPACPVPLHLRPQRRPGLRSGAAASFLAEGAWPDGRPHPPRTGELVNAARRA